MAFSVLVEAVNVFARKRKSSRVRLAAAATIPGAHLDARELGEVEAGNGHAVAQAEPAAAARPKSTPASRAQSRPKSAPRKPKTTR
jgi:hypothetical protein